MKAARVRVRVRACAVRKREVVEEEGTALQDRPSPTCAKEGLDLELGINSCVWEVALR